MQRFGQIIQLHADDVARYEELHASVWPEVVGMIKPLVTRAKGEWWGVTEEVFYLD